MKRVLLRTLPLLILVLLSLCIILQPAYASGPQDDLALLNKLAEQALVLGRAGDLSGARQAYDRFDRGWADIEDGIKDVSRRAYGDIEERMRAVLAAFKKQPPLQTDVVNALEQLVAINQRFITEGALGFPAEAPTAFVPVTMGSVIQLLQDARGRAVAGDYAGALALVKQGQTGWLEVEGLVKTRSSDDYRRSEDDLALAATLLASGSSEALPVLDRLATLLAPYQGQASYGVMDAAIILVREGLEALLVVVALLSFLNRVGEGSKQAWIWVGVGIGLLGSIMLALILQFAFATTVTAANRELVEGVTGLVAAAMLLYVSHWMHSKSSLAAWNQYIREQGTAALAKGSVWGLSSIAFLAIFREGAETALFYLGIAPSIAMSDLLTGIGLATVALVILGALMIGVGVRLPIRPFMTVASALVFFLCFKFIGTGIHALQVSGIIPATSATYLPGNGLLGVFPTWETTVAQLLLLGVAAVIVLGPRLRPGNAISQVSH